MSDDKIVPFPLVRTPKHATDELVNHYWELAQKLTTEHANNLMADPTLATRLDAEFAVVTNAETLLGNKPLSVVDKLFSTKRRKRPDIWVCRKCDYKFPHDTECPSCGSTDLGVFMYAPSTFPRGDREAWLTEQDPDWSRRFGGDVERAVDFYGMKP